MPPSFCCFLTLEVSRPHHHRLALTFLFQNETDDNQIQLVGGDVELPKELAKMIEQDNEEEEEKNSVIGQLSNIQNLDLDSLKDKASATLEDLKQSAEKCAVM